jgi:hypothetical protein
MSAWTDPRQAHALVVGIEKYRAGRDWDLQGPAEDAQRVVQWLLERDVPAEQILLFVSPLETGRGRSGPAGMRVYPATRDPIHSALTTELPRRRGGLLFLYWGGHGFMSSDGSRRLYFADATIENKLNLDFNLLLLFLRSASFPGLPRQLAIVDACQNYVDEATLLRTIPHETFPKGRPVKDRQQFVLFAAGPGELAKNSTSMNTGLFTSAVLHELWQTPPRPWPPDMEAVKRRLLDRFVQWREEATTRQTPTAFTFQTWPGDEGTIWGEGGSSLAEPTNGATYRVRDLPMPVQMDLVKRFLDTGFGDRRARDRQILLLRPALRELSPRDPRDLYDVLGMVQTAGEYPGGLQELVSVVRAFEGDDSVPMRDLIAKLRRVFPTWT